MRGATKRLPNNTLSATHRRMLVEGSAIHPEIAAERGYETVRRRAQLLEFKKYQRRAPSLRVPLYSPDGVTRLDQIRPDRPRKGGPKYETPGGAELIVDVHPQMSEEARNGTGDLWVTEGAKTGDSNTSRGQCTVVLAGVWGWCVPKVKPHRLRPCWDHIRLDGRRVLIAYDSDVIAKSEVQLAMRALAAALRERGADVWAVYLPDAPGGTKQGLDDYYAAGGTVRELKALARRYKPADIGNVRLSRDSQLRTAVDEQRRAWWEYDWARMVGTGERPNSMRGHTARDVKMALDDAAARHGQLVNGVLQVSVDTRSLALVAATSRPSAIKALRNLEAEGLIEIERSSARDKARTYRLLPPRATLYHNEDRDRQREQATRTLQACDRGGKGLRAPRLRWSSPGRKARRGVDKRTRRVRDNVQPAVPGYRRIGKVRGAVLDALDRDGGSGTISALCEQLRRGRPRDVRRRVLPMLEDAGIITVEGETVALTTEWLAAVDRARELGGEIEREHLDRAKYRIDRAAYHGRDEDRPTPHPANAGADGYVTDLRPSDHGGTQQADDRPQAARSPLAVAVRNYLVDNPRDACQPPGWIGTTLWAYELHPGKPGAGEVRAAIEELGGERYLRERLAAAKGAA